MIRDFKDLVLWQKSIVLVDNIYRLTKNFPREEVYGLTAQLRRAAVSIPSNTAEGFKRDNKNEFRQFLRIASGSIAEVETQVIIANNIGYISKQEKMDVINGLNELTKMITSLQSRLKSS